MLKPGDVRPGMPLASFTAEDYRSVLKAVREAVGTAEVTQSNVYLSGLDLETEVDAYATALFRVSWNGPDTVVANDLLHLLLLHPEGILAFPLPYSLQLRRRCGCSG